MNGRRFLKIQRKSRILLNRDETNRHTISFECTSTQYKTTEAGGYAEDALRMGFVSLGDGNSYTFTDKEKLSIKRRIAYSNKKRK